MTLPVDELHRELTPDEVYASLTRIQEALGLSTTSWRVGGVVRALNRAASYMVSHAIKLVVAVNRSAFGDTAADAWLDLRVADLYGDDVARIGETFARGNVLVSNALGGLYTYDAGELVLLNTAKKKTYANVEAVTIDPLEEDVEVLVQAVEAGSASTAAPGQIDALVTTALGLSVTHTETLIGLDKQSDADFLAAARESTGRLSPNGPRDAYAWRAKSVVRDDGTTIAVNRAKVSASGVPVLVTVASPDGEVDGDDVALIQAAVDEGVVPDGIEATVSSATALPVDVTATVYVRRTIGTVAALDIKTAIESKLANFFAAATSMPIGGFVIDPADGMVYRNALIGVIKALELEGVTDAPEHVAQIVLAAPAADIDVEDDEVPTLGTPTITVELI